MIRSSYSKTKAEVKFKSNTYNKQSIDEIWCLLFMDQVLVRVTRGVNNYELLKSRNRFSKRLVDLLENTNEVLLWRQVKKTGAKVLHIFKNSNDN